MNRTVCTLAGLLGASSLVLVDSAVKGTMLLVLAAAGLKFDRFHTTALCSPTRQALLMVRDLRTVPGALDLWSTVYEPTGSAPDLREYTRLIKTGTRASTPSARFSSYPELPPVALMPFEA